jgi:hypothetical protein
VVDDAYNAARDSAGRYVDLDNVGFVKAANDALDEGMLGALPAGQVRNMLKDVSTGKIPLNVEYGFADRIQLLRSCSAARGMPAERKALALSVMRGARIGRRPTVDDTGGRVRTRRAQTGRGAIQTARGHSRTESRRQRRRSG